MAPTLVYRPVAAGPAPESAGWPCSNSRGPGAGHLHPAAACIPSRGRARAMPPWPPGAAGAGGGPSAWLGGCVPPWLHDMQLVSWCIGQHSGLRIQRSRLKSARDLPCSGPEGLVSSRVPAPWRPLWFTGPWPQDLLRSRPAGHAATAVGQGPAICIQPRQASHLAASHLAGGTGQ